MGNGVICQLNTVADCLNLKVWGTIPKDGEVYFSSQNWVQKTLAEWLQTTPKNADAIRQAYEALPLDAAGHRDKKAKDNRYTRLKNKTPAYQFSHTCKGKSYNDLSGDCITGVYCIDIDDIPADQMQTIKDKLYQAPEVFAVGVSVSQSGFAVFVAYDKSGAPDTANKDDLQSFIERVFVSCARHINRVLGYPAADEAAKNPVRWRVCGPTVDIKPADTKLKTIPILDEIPDGKAKKTTRKLKNAEAALKGTAPGDKAERETRLQAVIFSCFDDGLSDADTAARARETLAGIAPDSSRLRDNEMERLVSDLRAKWSKRKSAGKPRELAREFCVGYRYDTFKCVLVAPDGRETTIDAAAAECSRNNAEISLNCAAEALITMVKENPVAQFDGLEKRVRALAAAYTAADAGAIDRYAGRCGYDAYESRRLALWLYQVCGRALKRGEKTDCMLVLAGHGEGTKKTMFFDAISRTLTGDAAPEYKFSEGKDGDLLLARAAVVVVDEIDKVLRKTDVAELKAKITQTQSCVRAPYERDAKTRKNAAVFGATTNDLNPIPAGENEARRYWVLNVTRPVNFKSTSEAESLMRAAAYTTLQALDAHAAEYDPLTVTGKIWVQTPAEERETADRNAGRKAADASTIAIAAGLANLKQFVMQGLGGKLIPARTWSVIFETGIAAPTFPVPTWTPPKAKAADICKLISARCNRRSTTEIENGKRRTVNGYSLGDLFDEFMQTAPGEPPLFGDGCEFKFIPADTI